MELRFAPLFSGSSGNCTYVGCDSGNFLIDAGMSGKKILSALEEVGVSPSSLDGLLVTHEHIDHIKGVGILSRKLNLPVYATEGTWDGMYAKVGDIERTNRRVIMPGEEFMLGGMEITPFRTPHDANESVGYSIGLGCARMTLCTDVGCVRDAWLQYAEVSDAVLLESNYDPGMLEVGPYPYDLKKRIASNKGHLSNTDCALTSCYLADHGVRQLVLGHLSKDNNFPELAYRTTHDALIQHGAESEMALTVARRDTVTGVFGITSELVQRWD